MEIADIKRRVSDLIRRARQAAADRRAAADAAGAAYAVFLENTAIPVVRQLANVLKVQGYPFTVFTPGGSVRLMSDRAAEDYVELVLDTTGRTPEVVGHVSHLRGRRVTESERVIAEKEIGELTEEDVLAFFLKELEPFVEK